MAEGISDFNFNVEIAKSRHVPYLKNPTLCVVIRKKVRANAIGPNTNAMQNIGKDVGRHDYVDAVPEAPLDMPIEFKELYRKSNGK